jgi:hypothetical protein
MTSACKRGCPNTYAYTRSSSPRPSCVGVNGVEVSDSAGISLGRLSIENSLH